jgi:hypothetical protein
LLKTGFVLYWELRVDIVLLPPEAGREGYVYFFTTPGRGKNQKLNVITIVLTKKP